MTKSRFFTGQPIFAQLLSHIPRSLVKRIAVQHSSDRYCKRFTTYDHLVTMLYSIFHQCSSLREVTTGMLAWEHRLCHLGIQHAPCRSTLSDANQRRQELVFASIYQQLLHRLQPFLPDSRSHNKMDERLYVFDSTTITLFGEVLRGAGIRGLDGKRKGGIKVHTLMRYDQDVPKMVLFSPSATGDAGFLKQLQLPAGSIVVFDRGYNHYPTLNRLTSQSISWITRLRKDFIVTVVTENQVDQRQRQKGIIADQQVILGSQLSRVSKVKARLITYTDPQTGQSLAFLTNNNRMAPATIAGLYRKRWQIEVLFKRLKQNYPLKYFLGDSENAIKIQIWCVLIADLLLKVTKQTAARRWSFANLASMIRLHLMTYINLKLFLKNPEKALRWQVKNLEQHIRNPTLFPY